MLGSNAMLELGPGGCNLMRAMRGARVVANELKGLVWRHKDGRKACAPRPIYANMYVTLGDQLQFGDGSQSELEVLTQRLHLSPQAVVAQKKGRKNDEKLAKRLRKQSSPSLSAHVSARDRRAAYC